MKHLLTIMLAATLVLLAGCSDDQSDAARDNDQAQIRDEIAADIAAEAAAQAAATVTPVPTSTPEPTATPIPEPTATATPVPEPTATATPTPEPTPDPLTQAQSIALEYNDLTLAILTDPASADLPRASGLEEPGSDTAGFAERLLTSVLNNNHYLTGDVRVEFLTSEVIEGQLLQVNLCMQDDGIWRDLDTEEITRESGTDPFLSSIEVSLESLRVVAVNDGLGLCEMTTNDA